MDREKEEIFEREFSVNSEGVIIRGFYCAPLDGSRLPGVIILHGIPRAKPAPGDQSYRDMAARFAGSGFAAVVFNFRGAGGSDGDISMRGWVHDLSSVLDFTSGVSQVLHDRIALLGFSAGGSVAIRVAAEDKRVAAVASVSSPAEFTFVGDTMPAAEWAAHFKEIGLIRSEGFPPSIEQWEQEFKDMEPKKWIGKIAPRPVLIMHGQEDEVIPVHHAKELHHAAGEPKDLVLIPGGKHRLRVDQRAVDAALSWLLKWNQQGPRT